MSKSKYWFERQRNLARSFFDCSAVRPLYLISMRFKGKGNNVFYSNEIIKCISTDDVESIIINRVPRTDLPRLIKEYSRVYYREVSDSNDFIYGKKNFN